MQVQFFSSLFGCGGQCPGPVIPDSPTATLDSQPLAEPRQCIFSWLLTCPSASSAPLCSENTTKLLLARVSFKCCKAVCGTWVLMPAPLFVSVMYLWMITCVTDPGAAWPHWCSSVRIIDSGNCRAACGYQGALLHLYHLLLFSSQPPLLLLFLFLISCQLLGFCRDTNSLLKWA